MEPCPGDCRLKCEKYLPISTPEQKIKSVGGHIVETDYSIKHDTGKPIAGCLEEFSHALEAMVEVFDAGRREGYARGSWENVEPERYKDAEWRHRLAGKRELVDQKSGLPHKFHEIWNALAQLELSERKRLSGGDCNILDL